MAEATTLACYDTATIAVVISFIVQAPRQVLGKLKTLNFIQDGFTYLGWQQTRLSWWTKLNIKLYLGPGKGSAIWQKMETFLNFLNLIKWIGISNLSS
jgi:hypothetical protein